VLPARVVIPTASLRTAIETTANLVGRSPQAARAEEVAGTFGLVTVRAVRSSIVKDLLDSPAASEADELAAQASSYSQPVVLVSNRDVRVAGATVVTAKQWRDQVLQLLR
jgi:hypothetical protein